MRMHAHKTEETEEKRRKAGEGKSVRPAEIVIFVLEGRSRKGPHEKDRALDLTEFLRRKAWIFCLLIMLMPFCAVQKISSNNCVFSSGETRSIHSRSTSRESAERKLHDEFP